MTSAEWLDVNYGAIMRSLVLNDLGGQSLHVVEPRALPFEGTQTTAVITAFTIGSRPAAIRLQDVESADQLKDLATAGRPVARERLQETPRWTGLLRTGPKPPPGFIELGELCRVHRGTVTGANATWVVRHHSYLPPSVLYPSVTKARELFAAGAVLASHEHLRLVVNIPAELDRLGPAERAQVARFIKAAKKARVDGLHRRAPPRLVVRRAQGASADPGHLHGAPTACLCDERRAGPAYQHRAWPVSPSPLDAHTLSRLAGALRAGAALSGGRTYAGGLVKFEPKEMERLMVPDLATLASHEPLSAAVDA